MVHTATTLPQLPLGGGSRVGRLYQTGVVNTTTTLPQLALGGGSRVGRLYQTGVVHTTTTTLPQLPLRGGVGWADFIK